jgi:hypothetical protein
MNNTKDDPLNKVKNTKWYECFIENTDLYICDKKVIEQAHRAAPNNIVKAYVFGIFESRQRHANLSGANF